MVQAGLLRRSEAADVPRRRGRRPARGRPARRRPDQRHPDQRQAPGVQAGFRVGSAPETGPAGPPRASPPGRRWRRCWRCSRPRRSNFSMSHTAGGSCRGSGAPVAGPVGRPRPRPGVAVAAVAASRAAVPRAPPPLDLVRARAVPEGRRLAALAARAAPAVGRLGLGRHEQLRGGSSTGSGAAAQRPADPADDLDPAGRDRRPRRHDAVRGGRRRAGHRRDAGRQHRRRQDHRGQPGRPEHQQLVEQQLRERQRQRRRWRRLEHAVGDRPGDDHADRAPPCRRARSGGGQRQLRAAEGHQRAVGAGHGAARHRRRRLRGPGGGRPAPADPGHAGAVRRRLRPDLGRRASTPACR